MHQGEHLPNNCNLKPTPDMSDMLQRAPRQTRHAASLAVRSRGHRQTTYSDEAYAAYRLEYKPEHAHACACVRVKACACAYVCPTRTLSRLLPRAHTTHTHILVHTFLGQVARLNRKSKKNLLVQKK